MLASRRSSNGVVEVARTGERTRRASLFRDAGAELFKGDIVVAFEASVADEVLERGFGIGLAVGPFGQLDAAVSCTASAHGDAVIDARLAVEAALHVVAVAGEAGADRGAITGADVGDAGVGPP